MKQKGFTLIELMIAISILGIIISLFIPKPTPKPAYNACESEYMDGQPVDVYTPDGEKIASGRVDFSGITDMQECTRVPVSVYQTDGSIKTLMIFKQDLR